MTNESKMIKPIPPLSNGKRVREDEDENQVRSKRQKIDEIAEKPKDKGEIISNDSSSYYEQNKDGATAIPPLSNEKRVREDEDENQVRSKKQKIDEVAQEPKNKGEIISNDSPTDSEQNKNATSNAYKPDLKTVEKDTSSSEEDDIGKSPHVVEKPVKGSDSSQDNEEEIEEKASKTAQFKTPATQKEKNAASKTIRVGKLSYSVERSDMEDLFKECGEIVDIRLRTDHEGRFTRVGYVEFATAEAAQKALELDNTELLRCPIEVTIASERGLDRSNLSNSFHKGETDQSQTVFVKGFDSSLGEEKIKASLEEHFGSCGEIAKITIPKIPDSCAVKGFAFLDFKDVDSLENALQLHETEFGGYRLVVQKARPRYNNRDKGHGRGVGGHQFDGRNGGGHGGRADWRKSSGGHQFCGRDGSDHSDRVNWGRSGGGHEFDVRDGDGHSGRGDWGRSGGGHEFDVRDGDGHSGRGDWGRSSGGYKFCGRDGGDPGGRVDWGRSGRGGGDHQFGARDGSDHGGSTVGWGSSRGGHHQFCGKGGGGGGGGGWKH